MRQTLLNLFGSKAQQQLLSRGAALRQVTRDTQHFTYYGRVVGVAQPQDAPIEDVIALARLQGNSHYADVPTDQVASITHAFEAEGLKPLLYARWEGSTVPLDRAKEIEGSVKWPAQYRLELLSADTGNATRQSLADTALACGVLPPSLAVLSGQAQPGVCAMLVNGAGDVVACAAAASFLHPDYPMGRDICWWGMLAVHPDHRGQGLSLPLGAQAILAMNEQFGFTSFFTGVEPGNSASEAVCTKMGLHLTKRCTIGVADPALIPGGRMTK